MVQDVYCDVASIELVREHYGHQTKFDFISQILLKIGNF